MKKGFTLVELLVVITIMAILSVVGITVFTGVQKKAQDAKVKGDVTAFASAYELKYNQATGNYSPSLDSSDFVGGIPLKPDRTPYSGSGGAGCTSSSCDLLGTGNTDKPFQICAILSTGERYCKDSVRISDRGGTVTRTNVLIADLSPPTPTTTTTSPPVSTSTPTSTSPTTAPCPSTSPTTAPTSCSTLLPSLCEGLVAYWKMDETCGVRVDATGRGNNLTPTGTLSATTGIQGNAAGNFASAGEYLTREDNPDLSLVTDKTFAFWMKFSGITHQAVISKFEPSSPGAIGAWGRTEYKLDLFNAGSIGYFTVGMTDGRYCNLTLSLPQNIWNFVVLWYRGGNQVGVQVGTGTTLGAPQTASCASAARDLGGGFAVGRWQTKDQWGVVNSYTLNGFVDELGVWNKVLSDEEKTTLFNSGQGRRLF